jgi:trigger factor
MHITIDEIGPCKKKLNIEVDKEKVLAEIQKSFTEVRKNLALPGFRRGHVPESLVRKRFNEEINTEVKDKLINESYDKAVEDYNLKPLGDTHPENVEFKPEEGLLKYTVTMNVVPEFELPEYKGIKVTRPKVEVLDADVDRSIEVMKRDMAEWHPVEGEIEEKDLVLADVTLSVEGKTAAKRESCGISPEHGMFAGMQLGDDVKNAVVGKKAGDKFELKVTVPENSGALEVKNEFRGKPGVISAAITEAKRVKLPEDKDLLDRFDFETMDELKAEARKQIEKERGADADAAVENQILDKILDVLNFDMPEDMIKREAELLAEKRHMDLHRRGVKEDEIHKTMEGYQKTSEGEIRKSFKAQLLVRKIAEKEKIFCTEEDVNARISAMAAVYNKPVEQIKALYEERGWINTMREEIRAEKVRIFLRENAEIADKIDGHEKSAPEEAPKA